MRDQLKAAIAMLYGLKRSVYLAPYGICANLVELSAGGVITQGLKWHIKDLMRKWPEYTGQPDYPVPGVGRYAMCPETTYDMLPSGEYFKGAYGGNRIRLVNFLIRALERELEVEYA